MEYKMDPFVKIVHGYAPSTIFIKIYLQCSTEFEHYSTDSKPLLTFSKRQVAELFAN